VVSSSRVRDCVALDVSDNGVVRNAEPSIYIDKSSLDTTSGSVTQSLQL
jgi:hypothetical protein